MSNVNISGGVSVANGTVLLPALTFYNDLDCGFYRVGANDIGLAINGVKTAEYTATAVTLAPAGTTTLNLAATSSALGQATDSYSIRTVNGSAATPGGLSTVQAAAAVNASATLTTAQVLGGIITSTTAAATNCPLPSAVTLVAALPGVAIGDTIQFTVVNTGPNTFTVQTDSTTRITVGGTGGANAVATATSGRFAIRFTNVTGTTEAGVLYRLA